MNQILLEELRQLARQTGWSDCFVEISNALGEEVRAWCLQNIGPQYYGISLDIPMVRRVSYNESLLAMNRYCWLRVVHGYSNRHIYVFRRYQDAVFFKLRWF